MAVKLTRTQRRIARAFDEGAHLQSFCRRHVDCDDCVQTFVLVHTCDVSIDPDGFLYTELVRWRTLFALHMAKRLPPDADIVIGFGGEL